MVTRRYITTSIGLVCVGMFIGLAAEFTEKRAPKNTSVNTLKEECCEQFGTVLKQIPQLLQSVAHVQTEALTAIQGYWEGDKQSWCAQASRQKLSQCRERLMVLQKKINAVVAECDQTLKEIRA